MNNWIKNILTFEPKKNDDTFNINDNTYSNVSRETFDKDFKISSKIRKNEDYIKERFRIPLNNDVILRSITLKGERKAFLVMYDGMVNTDSVDAEIIRTLLEIPHITDEMIYTKREAVIEKLVSHSQAMATEDIEKIVEEINFGSCALFVDGINMGFVMDVRSWEHRQIDKPDNEQSIYGPQEAFAEMLRGNSALVRKILKTENLICEEIKVGKISKTRGVLMYISDLANNSLVDEVRNRINGIKMDYVIAIEEISMMIEEKTFMMTTQILGTERPDRVARALSEGRVALILNGSPRALIFPTNAFELTHAASDAYIRVPYANMTRFIRLIAMFVSVLLPGLYLAITLYHQEMVPTYLLYSISASRENVPFPSLLEMILMDFSFEMIREAGIRMPSPIGSTLGIVGGLILGQAAVSAKIVSPIMIIVIAITGIGSFATPDYSLSWSYRVLRVGFILAGAFCGFFGIALGIYIYSVYLGAQKSFGIPFLAPLPSGGWGKVGKSLFVTPIWKREKRPEFLHPKREEQQPKISRRWKF